MVFGDIIESLSILITISLTCIAAVEVRAEVSSNKSENKTNQNFQTS